MNLSNNRIVAEEDFLNGFDDPQAWEALPETEYSHSIQNQSFASARQAPSLFPAQDSSDNYLDGPISEPVAVGSDGSHVQFSPGDHVYMACNAVVMDYQHHGIVIKVNQSPPSLTLVDFTNNEQTIALPQSLDVSSSIASSKSENSGGLRILETEPKDFRVVRYGADAEECHNSCPGTCTTAHNDCRRVVLDRVQFLIDNPQVLPTYEVLEANCECVAVWCKTGVWTTTQVATVLTESVTKNAGLGMTGAVAIGSLAEAFLGVAGWATHPLIPIVGALAIGASRLILNASNEKWKSRTELLNEAFKRHTAARAIQRCWKEWKKQKAPNCVVS